MTSVPQLSFTGGEWAPSLYVRADLEKYSSAVKLMRNAYCHAHGGVSNRPGTYVVGEVKDSSKVTRMVSFQFSTVQAYGLEFGDLYMRVYKDGGRVLESNQNVVSITQANPGVVGVTSHGYSNGEWISASDIGGMTELNGKLFKVAGVTTHTFQLQDTDGNNVDTSAYTAFTSGGTVARVYTLTTPYAEADLGLLKFVQSADVLKVTHPSYAPYDITRTGHAAWTATAITFAPSISAPASFARSAGAGTGSTYAATAVKENGEESLVSSDATGGAGDTFTWTAVSGAEYYNFYQKKNGVYGWLGTAGLNGGSPSFIVPSGVDADMDEAPPTAKTPFTGAGNYPGVSTFFQGRWVPARTNNLPQTFWGTVTGSYKNMNIRSPIHDDDAYNFQIDSRQVNEIRWMVPLDVLIIGTSGSEWRAAPGQNGTSITPSSVDLKQQSEWGVSHIQPLVIGNTILFIDGSEKQVRDLLYSLEVDGYSGNDLSILAVHLFEQYTLEQWAYQRGTDPIVWAVRSDGTLLGMTYHREHKVWGWHRHDTEGTFEDVISVRKDNGRSDVYFIVKRTINGVTRRFVELLADRYFADIRDAFFVDCGLSLDSPITVTGITQAAEGVVTAAAHGLLDGARVDLSDIVGMTELNLRQFIVSDKTTDTFKLKDINTEAYIDTSEYTAYVSGGYAREAVLEVSGLEHLEGEEVAIFANGNVISGKTVTDGAVTIENYASRIHVGKAYTQDVMTLDFNNYKIDTGTAQDRVRYVSSAVLKLKDTRALFYGPPLLTDEDGNEDDSRLQELKLRTDEGYGDPITPFTGDREVNVEMGGDNREAVLFFRNPYPVPFTILAVIPRVVHGES